MTKRKVNFLMGLMAISIIGIIVLQLVWMNNALKVRNELFDRSVNEALFATSERIETLSDVFWVHDLVKRGNAKQYLPKVKHQTNSVLIHNDTIQYSYNSKSPTKHTVDNHIKIFTTPNGDSINREVMVEVIQMDSVINNWEEKIDHNITLMINQSINGNNLDSTIVYESREIEKRFGKKREQLKNVAGRMLYETWSMDRNYMPDTTEIRSVLKEELSKRDVPIHFEMGVLYKKNKLLLSPGADSILIVTTNYSAGLYPGNIFDNSSKLSVYFPARKTFVLKTLFVPAFLSVLFCGFIMLVFGLSIYYIINQKKVSEMKSDFINNMTHEFKTPLATISLAVDTIVNHKIIDDKEKIKHFTDIIKKENLRMNQQVETILQIARLDKKDFEFNFRIHDIHEIIHKAVQGIMLQVQNKGGKVEFMKNATNPIITTDASHMLNLLSNLLDNANKYSPNSPEIVIITSNSQRGVWISISDKGIGMTKQVQQKIFEKFYRETTGNVHNVKGFGLGLSYAKAVIEANKGEINVQSEPGKGSTFEVFIPFTFSS